MTQPMPRTSGADRAQGGKCRPAKPHADQRSQQTTRRRRQSPSHEWANDTCERDGAGPANQSPWTTSGRRARDKAEPMSRESTEARQARRQLGARRRRQLAQGPPMQLLSPAQVSERQAGATQAGPPPQRRQRRPHQGERTTEARWPPKEPTSNQGKRGDERKRGGTRRDEGTWRAGNTQRANKPRNDAQDRQRWTQGTATP